MSLCRRAEIDAKLVVVENEKWNGKLIECVHGDDKTVITVALNKSNICGV